VVQPAGPQQLQVPLTHTVPGPQQIVPHPSCPLGQQTPLLQLCPAGQHTVPLAVAQVLVAAQQAPLMHTLPLAQQVAAPAALMQPVCPGAQHTPLLHTLVPVQHTPPAPGAPAVPHTAVLQVQLQVLGLRISPSGQAARQLPPHSVCPTGQVQLQVLVLKLVPPVHPAGTQVPLVGQKAVPPGQTQPPR
jgi:hypothetical protein